MSTGPTDEERISGLLGQLISMTKRYGGAREALKFMTGLLHDLEFDIHNLSVEVELHKTKVSHQKGQIYKLRAENNLLKQRVERKTDGTIKDT
ncbi:MAG: hypothetical protein GY923_15435 [Aestuariibacter sp.]|nr:hypothetical protein [Aestuariibacter sp.]